jgi:hypothetical protein
LFLRISKDLIRNISWVPIEVSGFSGGYSPIVVVLVLVLDFFGRGKRADCQQPSKVENENEDDDEDEDDWRGAYTAVNTYFARPQARL